MEAKKYSFCFSKTYIWHPSKKNILIPKFIYRKLGSKGDVQAPKFQGKLIWSYTAGYEEILAVWSSRIWKFHGMSSFWLGSLCFFKAWNSSPDNWISVFSASESDPNSLAFDSESSQREGSDFRDMGFIVFLRIGRLTLWLWSAEILSRNLPCASNFCFKLLCTLK